MIEICCCCCVSLLALREDGIGILKKSHVFSLYCIGAELTCNRKKFKKTPEFSRNTRFTLCFVHSLSISAYLSTPTGQLATRESCIAIESHISIKFRLPLCVSVLCVLYRFAAGLINQASVERCFFGRGYRCKCYCYLTDSDKRPGNFPSNWSLCLCV